MSKRREALKRNQRFGIYVAGIFFHSAFLDYGAILNTEINSVFGDFVLDAYKRIVS